MSSFNISICKNRNISFKVYRKSTDTDHVIPHDSNHLPEHKMSAINYLTNRLITQPLNDIDKNKEHDTIRRILHNDKYDPQLLDRTMSTINTKLQIQQNTYTTPTKLKTKWATFTYIVPQPRFITKIFKNTNINTAYKTNNTIKKRLSHHTKNQFTTTSAKFNKSGVYELNCPDCTWSTQDRLADSFSQGIANIFEIINMAMTIQIRTTPP